MTDEPVQDIDTVLEMTGPVLVSQLRQKREVRVTKARQDVEESLWVIRSLTDRIQSQSRELATRRAHLDELTSKENADDTDLAIFRHEIELMAGLPGVIGFTVRDDVVYVQVQAITVIGRWKYDLGDFEIALWGGPTRLNDVVTCLRSGTLYRDKPLMDSGGCCVVQEANTYEYPRYWHPDSYRQHGGVGNGWFCFGRRENNIERLRQSGRYAEMLSLMIATMCSYNRGDGDIIAKTYTRSKASKSERARFADGQHEIDE